MGLELDLFLLPEDKGIKITAIEREIGREESRSDNRGEASPGKSFSFLEARGIKHCVKPLESDGEGGENNQRGDGQTGTKWSRFVWIDSCLLKQVRAVRRCRQRRHSIYLCMYVMDGMCLQLGLLSPSHPKRRSGRRTRLSWIAWVNI